MIEELNIPINQTKYLLPLEQLKSSIKQLTNI